MPLTNYRLPDCASSSFISAANFAAAARSGDFLAYLRARAWLKPFRTADNAFSLSYSHASFCGITRANRSTMSWPCCSTIIVRFAKASPSVIRPLESVCLVTVLIWIMNTVFTTIPQMSSGKVGIKHIVQFIGLVRGAISSIRQQSKSSRPAKTKNLHANYDFEIWPNGVFCGGSARKVEKAKSYRCGV